MGEQELATATPTSTLVEPATPSANEVKRRSQWLVKPVVAGAKADLEMMRNATKTVRRRTTFAAH